MQPAGVINKSTWVMNKKHIANEKGHTYNGTYKRWYPLISK